MNATVNDCIVILKNFALLYAFAILNWKKISLINDAKAKCVNGKLYLFQYGREITHRINNQT